MNIKRLLNICKIRKYTSHLYDVFFSQNCCNIHLIYDSILIKCVYNNITLCLFKMTTNMIDLHLFFDELITFTV